MKTLNELMDLSGRKALITGGAGHIGLAAAQALIELGARVAILDRDAQLCQGRVEELNRIRPDCALPIVCDLSDEGITRAAMREAIDVLDGLDILVHSAAYVGTTDIPGWAVPFAEQTVEAWDKGMKVNLTSVFVMIQEALEALSNSGHGSVIMFSSIYGMVGSDMSLYEGTKMPKVMSYSAAKAGIIQLARMFATQFGPNLRVNSITPGGVLRGQPDSFRSIYESRTPLKRMAYEEDMKGAVAYLASDLSAYVTGQNIVVDGGWTAW